MSAQTAPAGLLLSRISGRRTPSCAAALVTAKRCATIIVSASKEDDEGRWVKHKGKPTVHGFKAHVGADADTALVEEVAITPANINDGKAGPETLPDNPAEVFADSAYRGPHFRNAIHAKGGTPRIIATAMWGVIRFPAD